MQVETVSVPPRNKQIPDEESEGNPKTVNRSILVAIAMIAMGIVTAAPVTNKTYRTTAALAGVQQGEDPTAHLPQYDYVGLAGHNLVNLARGRDIGNTNFLNEVLAMTIARDRSAASLVVYNRDTDSVIATLADNTRMDSVVQQDSTSVAGLTRARLVPQFTLDSNGDGTNGILDGYLTAAGRLVLDPATGCPKPIPVLLDRDPKDRFFGDKDEPANVDKDERIILRAGLAHVIGVVDLVSASSTNTVLVPLGRLSIRRELPIAP